MLITYSVKKAVLMTSTATVKNILLVAKACSRCAHVANRSHVVNKGDTADNTVPYETFIATHLCVTTSSS